MSANALTLARPYARAAFELARESGVLADWSQRLGFSALMAENEEVAALLGHPDISQADKVRLLLPEGDTPEGVYGHFLAVLAENRRLALLPQVAEQYELLRAEAEQVVRAKVRSAVALELAQMDRLRAALRRRFGREVELRNEIDPSLIGGAVIDAGELVIDGSVRGQLERLHGALTH